MMLWCQVTSSPVVLLNGCCWQWKENRKQFETYPLPFPAPQEVARLTQQLTGAQTVQEEQEKTKAVELQEQLSSKQHNGWNEAAAYI